MVPLKASLLIGLGLLLALTAAATGLADAQRDASPFDHLDDPIASTQGFEPITVAEGGLDEPPSAPTLPPQISGPSDVSPSSVPTTVATAAAVNYVQHELAADPALPPTAVPVWIPDRIVIPAIQLDAPVVASALKEVMSWGKLYQQWVAPDKNAAGWHTTSAPLGVAGNTVLNGHHNIRGEVFGHLADLKLGDLISVQSGTRTFTYRIVVINILPERWQPLEARLANAQWIQPSQDERLTLVTCWPYASNTHRLVIVATPVASAAIDDYEMIPRVTPHPPRQY